MSDPQTETLILLAGVLLLLVCSAFFSGSETALMSSSKPKLHKMEKEGNASASRVNRVISDPERLLGTILLGNNLVNIGASALTTGLFITLFGQGGIAIATLVMTFMVLIFSEIIPKTIASRNPEKHSLWISLPMSWLMFILRPFTAFIGLIANGILYLLGLKKNDSGNFDEDDVRGAIGMGLEEGVLEKGEHRMLDSVLKLDEMTVEDVMTHRSEIETLNADLSMDELYKAIAEKPVHSRLPLWRDDADNIIGFLLVKDFYRAHYNAVHKGIAFDIEKVMQKPYFVPENVILSEQLLEFQRHRRHMALVVDEYGDIQGLITLEDAIEEIVGEIEDEHDIVTTDFVRETDGSISLSGRFAVRDANREFDWELPEDEEAVTIAGMVIDAFGGMPKVGDSVEISGIKFRVKVKKKQAILKLVATSISVEVEEPENVQDNTDTTTNIKDEK